MENTTPTPPKKGLGPLAWLGIGCGGIIVLGIVAVVIFVTMKARKFAENPTRATATTMVTVSVGLIEMVKEDDANKRYTVRAKENGKLTTIYWDEKKQAPAVVEGDFSAIPTGETVLPPP